MQTILTNETSSLPSDGEEENNEFTGATLKISSFESPYSSLRFRGVDLNTSSVMENSAILTGLDDPTSPIALKKPKEPEEPPKQPTTAAEYFSLRPGQFEKAVNDCINTMLRPAGDTDVQGSWLLTEWVFVLLFWRCFEYVSFQCESLGPWKRKDHSVDYKDFAYR